MTQRHDILVLVYKVERCVQTVRCRRNAKLHSICKILHYINVSAEAATECKIQQQYLLRVYSAKSYVIITILQVVAYPDLQGQTTKAEVLLQSSPWTWLRPHHILSACKQEILDKIRAKIVGMPHKEPRFPSNLYQHEPICIIHCQRWLRGNSNCSEIRFSFTLRYTIETFTR